MILSFKCSPELKGKIDILINKGLYEDFSSFCTVALENQLLLEETYLQPANSVKPLPVTNKSKPIKSVIEPEMKLLNTALSSPQPVNQETRANASESLSLAHLAEKPPFVLPTANPDMFTLDQQVPVERWLFGQYNRLFPVKVSVRALAILSGTGKDALVLDQVGPQIAEIAAQFGNHLRELDKRYGKHRDDALATAFPDAGAEGQKGKVRYQNQFVGQTVKGEQGGLLIGLKLAIIQIKKNKPHIFLTTAGWDLARLPNPLLDLPATETTLKLSEEDISFMLKHISKNVPVELFPYRVLLSLIAAGNSTPDTMNQGIAKFLGPERKLEEEQAFISTQRTGVLGRMSDLDLIGRTRQGTRITYNLTPRGQHFLKEIGTI